eukprot:CAMPEP_0206128036 /NCGR_PEP_ID=MMETSP1472-20131121/30006_1 /ASSEMBLY_ACC=CAM_ASM_001108 /TAXON_ID=41880 /ORGANISM="Pycnococcus provasolii, Strain RCC251" /LENGTH=150 /DNA_ID=CAMNT_0053519197 /DNA_START=60 /DNA_END=513 /DNA_ORIENTATION=+
MTSFRVRTPTMTGFFSVTYNVEVPSFGKGGKPYSVVHLRRQALGGAAGMAAGRSEGALIRPAADAPRQAQHSRREASSLAHRAGRASPRVRMWLLAMGTLPYYVRCHRQPRDQTHRYVSRSCEAGDYGEQIRTCDVACSHSAYAERVYLV